ncbi:hypothetical protein [Haladaptatus sp. DYF46]|uniref:hypothetical protein n=1 Tax=Haladaptatus sp. DYF46 TaxID=2886041 RepID=UPI001E41E3ED|nr:hypothetical protein [Haladaptatus sp. DYF46]
MLPRIDSGSGGGGSVDPIEYEEPDDTSDPIDDPIFGGDGAGSDVYDPYDSDNDGQTGDQAGGPEPDPEVIPDDSTDTSDPFDGVQTGSDAYDPYDWDDDGNTTEPASDDNENAPATGDNDPEHTEGDTPNAFEPEEWTWPNDVTDWGEDTTNTVNETVGLDLSMQQLAAVAVLGLAVAYSAGR